MSRLLRCFFHDIDQHNASKSYLRISDCNTTRYVPMKWDQRFFYESVWKTELSWRNMWVKLPAQHSIICASSEKSENYWRRRPAKRYSLHLFLDYYNCLLYSWIDYSLFFMLRKLKYDSISADVRDRLHWLPVKRRIEFKIKCVLVLSAKSMRLQLIFPRCCIWSYAWWDTTSVLIRDSIVTCSSVHSRPS